MSIVCAVSDVAFIIKQILLGNTCVFTENTVIKAVFKAVCDHLFDPNVHRKSIKTLKSEKQCTGGDLRADTLY